MVKKIDINLDMDMVPCSTLNLEKVLTSLISGGMVREYAGEVYLLNRTGEFSLNPLIHIFFLDNKYLRVMQKLENGNIFSLLSPSGVSFCIDYIEYIEGEKQID